MPYLICYDISKNSLRTKMGKTIIATGLDRINKSVYLGTISESSLKNLETKLNQWLTTKGDPQDSLIIINVTKESIKSMRIFGQNDLDKDELTGERSTLMI